MSFFIADSTGFSVAIGDRDLVKFYRVFDTLIELLAKVDFNFGRDEVPGETLRVTDLENLP